MTWAPLTWKFVAQRLATASPGEGVQPPPAASLLVATPVSPVTGGEPPFGLVCAVTVAWFEAGCWAVVNVALVPVVMGQSPDSGTPPNALDAPAAMLPQL